MRRTSISQGGQMQIPAAVRRRWGTRAVLLDDRGGSLVVRPVPDDPIGAAIGSLGGSGRLTEEIRRQEREAEAERETSAYQP
jgi:bifunctional DNA-binding transcriptional regulator/antitoxin component of YhaV-PrlF toxin-antitoxin module